MKEGAPSRKEKKNGNITTQAGEEFWNDGVLELRVLRNGTVENYVDGKLDRRIFQDGSEETFDWDGTSLGRHKKELKKTEPVSEKEHKAATQKHEKAEAADLDSKEEQKELEAFKKNRSKTLLENPKAKLDQYKEVLAYLSKLDKKYRDRIIELASQRPPMDEDCKVAICIPVAGHQEDKNIYESLKNYTYQTRENFEIVLFVNHPKKDQKGNLLNAQATLSEIERFKKDYPELNVRVMYEALPNEEIAIGKIRKLLTDATLVAQHERGAGAPDLIIISNDADNKGVDPRYIRTFLGKFEDPQIDGCLGQLDWDPESYQKFPAIHLGTRLFQYLNIIGRRRSGGMVSSGANSAFRSSIYAGIGGYMENLKEGEDVAIGRAIIAARGNNKNSFGFAGAGTRLFTSSRRAIDALYSGLSPVEQWDKGFSAFDDEIRKVKADISEIVNYDNPKTVTELKELLEYIINRTLEEYETGEKLGKKHSFYEKALGWMGIKYDLDTQGNVVIEDMGPIVESLKKYQTEGKLIRDARSGKPEAKEKLKIVRKNQQPSQKKESRLEDVIKMPMDSVPNDTLLKNSEAKLDPLVEIEQYLKRMNPIDLEILVRLEARINEPMSAETKAVVCIPVAGHQEGHTIYKTLESFSNQKNDPKEFEILLFVNSPIKETRKGEMKAITQTLTEIKRAEIDFPRLNIRHVYSSLAPREVRIGNIRKILTDLAVLRQKTAGIKGDLILLSNDADNEGISEGYIEAYKKYFAEHPEKEAAVGNLQFDPNAFIRFPILHLKQELATFLDQVGFQNENVTLFGANSCMKSSIYASIGGYPPGLKTGEQYWTGEKIRKLPAI